MDLQIFPNHKADGKYTVTDKQKLTNCNDVGYIKKCNKYLLKWSML